MPITLPSFVAPNELIQSAWGNGVVNALDELDDETVKNTTAQVMTGRLSIDLAAGSQALYLGGSSSTVVMTMADSFDQVLFEITSNTNGAVLASDNELVLMSENVERWRAASGIILTGKSVTNLALPGTETMAAGTSNGSIRSTIDTASLQNMSLRHTGTADANTEIFAQFVAGAAAIRGSITQVSSTGVAYNTTSDERLKTVLRDLDDDEIATILRMISPVVFEFNSDPGNEHVGFIAQQLAATWPTFVDVGIVTPGIGEPGDVEVVDVNGDLVTAAFRPWMVDLSKLAPLLVAGWQQLDRRLTAIEAG